MDNLAVTVLCFTYNQVDYLSKAIEGMLNQRTSFNYEIIIHDDASTDGTVALLKSWEKRDSRIRVVYEKSNRYFENGRCFDEMLWLARGRYIAQCEGDDYWTDCDKLQAQYDYMESHPECALCAHSATVICDTTGRKAGVLGMGTSSTDFSADEIAAFWRLPTAGLFYKRDDARRFEKEWGISKPVGDYPRAVFYTRCGYGHYWAHEACVYNYGVANSWTSTNRDSDSKQKEACLEWLDMLRRIDEQTDGDLHVALVKNAQTKVMKLLSMCGIGYQLPPIGEEARDTLSLRQNATVRLLRSLWVCGFTLQRRAWSGIGQWRIVRRTRDGAQ